MNPRPEAADNAQKYPKLVLGAWHGIPFPTLCRLMSQNRCSFSWGRADRLLTIVLASVFNSTYNTLDNLVYSRRVRNVQLDRSPLFILGHWRTGTTLLHELLIRDPQFSYPNTYQCLAPGHFLLTQKLLPRLLWFLLPRRRPMDNMNVGWDRPQEDEFALCNLGVPSPYYYWLYPDRPCPYDHYLELEGLSPRELQLWKEGLVRFLKRVSLRDPRTLVLKSPTHTARVNTLLELFPDAKFVHLVRDPQIMIPSAILTWRRLGEVFGIRKPIRDDLDEYVLDTFHRLNENFQQNRSQIPQQQLFEVRYEDLTADTIGVVGQIYEHLELGDFEVLRPHLEDYARTHKAYRKNRFSPDSRLTESIQRVCGEYSRQYGYDEQAASPDKTQVAAEN